MSLKCCFVKDNEALVENSDQAWAQLSCTDTKLKYYGREWRILCVRAFLGDFFITAKCLKNLCKGCVEQYNLRI